MCNWYIQLIVIRGDRRFLTPTTRPNKVICHAVWNFPWHRPAQNNIFHKINFPKHSEEKYAGTVCVVSKEITVLLKVSICYTVESFNLLISPQNKLRNYFIAAHLLPVTELKSPPVAAYLFAKQWLKLRWNAPSFSSKNYLMAINSLCRELFVIASSHRWNRTHLGADITRQVC